MILFICFLAVFIISLGAFVGSILGYGGTFSLLLSVLSLGYIFGCLHEYSHILACKLTKAKIAKIFLFIVKYENGKWRLSKTLCPFRVSFYSGKNNAFVYLFGIIFSLALALIFGALYLCFQSAWLLPPFVVCLLVLLCNCIGKGSDLKNAIKNLRQGE
jgi:hypothetical protein